MAGVRIRSKKGHFIWLTILLLVAGTGARAQTLRDQDLLSGFRSLYELKFAKARSTFRAWEVNHSDDPKGPAAEAASYLFEEFYRQGVLTSQFFLDDKRLLNGIGGKPDPELGTAFQRSITHAQNLAMRRLEINPEDADALFALTITRGMQANYAGVIEKHQLQSIKYIQRAESYANKLLSFEPDAQDVLVALGASNYIIGCLPGYKKFFLFFGGIHGDKQEGMRQLAMAGAHGYYLRPYAKILLALAALREKQQSLARTQLEELVAEFPSNPLFARELSSLNRVPMQVRTDP